MLRHKRRPTKTGKDKAARMPIAQNSTINAISALIECRDPVTGGHVSRTQKYMQLLIKRMVERGVCTREILSWGDMDSLLHASKLHDLGKLFVSDAILNKPGKLTPEEFEIMKTHVTSGVKAIRLMEACENDSLFLRHAEVIAHTHHEKWDGSGYPRGLKGRQIPLLGRLMAIADVYDALTSERPYKKPMSPAEANKIIEDGFGTHFDPGLADVFKAAKSEFALVAQGANERPIKAA